MRAYLAPSWLILLLAPACAPDLEHVSTRVSEVCVRGIPLEFDGQRGGSVTSRVALIGSFDSAVLAADAVTLSSLAITAGPEIDDFAFASRIDIHLTADAGEDLPLAELHGGEDVRSLQASGDPDTDLTEHLLAGDTGVEVAITGAVPGSAWSARMDLCLAVEGLDELDTL